MAESGGGIDASDDAGLMAAARAGDAEAINRLLGGVSPAVLRFGLRMCRNEADAEDVLQETLWAAARGLPEFRGDAALSTWLFTIARSFCLKRRGRSKFAPRSTLALEEVSVPSEVTENPEQLSSRREFVELLERAIAGLEPAQREVLVLRDIEGLSLQEVAVVVESNVGAVKSRLHRARARLRAELERSLPARPAGGGEGCPDVSELFSRFLEDEMGAEECAAMQAHVATCARCNQACELLERALGQCRSFANEPPSDAAQRAVRAALRRVISG